MRTKEDIKEYKKQWHIKNKNRMHEKAREWRDANRDKLKEYHKQYKLEHPNQKKEWNIANKEYVKAYRIANKERDRATRLLWEKKNKQRKLDTQREYYCANKKKALAANKKWFRNALKTNPELRIKVALRDRLRAEIRKGKILGFSGKTKKITAMIGCTMDDLKLYLETNMDYGMNWSNHGLRGWHIDHIKPCAAFNLNDPIQMAECFHYTNLQPLWWQDNLAKKDKF